MSKYIKLEDAIRKYAEMIADEAYWEHGVGDGNPDKEDLDIARKYYSNLPIIEVDEDAISREYVLRALNGYGKDWQEDCEIADVIRNAPSAVQVPNEDCISRGYLERKIENQIMTAEKDDEYWPGWSKAMDKAVELIESAPSVAPRLDKEDLEDIYEHISESYVEGYMDGHAEGEWIPCSERLPKTEEKVWIQTERGKVCFAMYEDGTISEEDSAWCWYDIPFDKWDEENDCGIIPEGWWEWTEFHPDNEFDCPVDEVVVAWMPLPEQWKGVER